MKISIDYAHNWKLMIAIASLVLGLALSFIFVDIRFAFIYFFIWLDRVVIAYTRFLWEFGIETYTIPIAFSGILYGPLFGFLTGFILLPVMDVFRYLISPPMQQVVWPPLIPSPDSFVDGMPGAVSGLLKPFIPFMPLIFVSVMVRITGVVLKDRMYGIPPKPAYLINIIYNIFLASMLAFILAV